jgi:hypothetical protein
VTKPVVLAVLAAALAAFSVFQQAVPHPAPPPSPTPANSDLAKAFAAVAPGDRVLVGSVYETLAAAVERDATRITRMGVLAEGIGLSLDFAFDGRKPSADGSLGRAIDAHIAAALGFPAGEMLDIVVTPTSRPKIVAALRSVAAAAR